MKNRPPSTRGTARALWRRLAAVLSVAVFACSDSAPLVTDPAPPASPADVLDPLLPSPGGEEPTTYGTPGAAPVSVPVENDGPGATETNFLTPPCGKDSDCGDGRRCVDGARAAAAGDGADGGGAQQTDGGAGAGDASVPSADGGVVLGRCESIDGG